LQCQKTKSLRIHLFKRKCGKGSLESDNSDGETYVRILSDVRDKKSNFSLHTPSARQQITIIFLVKTAKERGALQVCLVAPYLSYMRQDSIFNPGEGVTSNYFAHLVSGFVDSLITIDPHLHRIKSLSEIYSIPTKVSHAKSYFCMDKKKYCQSHLNWPRC
jgi:ribose-phosphate pyrophosphokinase